MENEIETSELDSFVFRLTAAIAFSMENRAETVLQTNESKTHFRYMQTWQRSRLR